MKRLLQLALFALVFGMPAISKAELEVVTEPLQYKDGNTELQGILAYPKGSERKLPGIVIFPEWWGRGDYTAGRAKQYAAQGFVVLAAEIYGGGKFVETAEEASALSKPFYEDRALFKRRVQAAYSALTQHAKVDGKRMAALGYCFGGTAALELARSGADLEATVVFHGGLGTPHPKEHKNIKGRVLVLNGADDPFVPHTERVEFKAHMDAAKIPYRFIDYAGAQHAFSNPAVDSKNLKGAAYNRDADVKSFKRSVRFLEHALAADGPGKRGGKKKMLDDEE